MQESMMHRCRIQVWAHPGLTTWELAEVTGIGYYVLARRLPALRNNGSVRNGDKRICRITKKPCLTWFPAGEGADEFIAKAWSRPELLPSEQPPVDPALISPPDPETERVLETWQGRLYGWITREAIEDTKRVWSPCYKYALSDGEAIEILQNVRNLAEVLVKAKQEQNAKTPPTSHGGDGQLDYNI